ncbi:hypothetical protein CMQ_5615 [Grosmannia clavigera kw1407]|uniref:Uncharacterized protein n=1 Tax=Grosmannia clavigera (strain kw1407 / UAMH 11150) TaxID=655863 RepID=F0XT59_GROCL|nr:uncharacterized protein CMQ_5615 [Grosmannia clavigera kw1407]EFW99194.1 hypothetical protein CMQ_5615 [Grosmannia clavigera kw1407]
MLKCHFSPSPPPRFCGHLQILLSYAEIAAKGPKQSPEEAAAPAMPEIEPSESAASTVSLIDVDTPSIRTVPSEFGEQSVTTETQAERLEQEAAAAATEAKVHASKAAARARSKTEGTAKRAASQARRADRWITAHFAAVQEDHPVVAQAAVVGNFAAVIGLGALLGFRAWGLYDQGRFSWKAGAAGLGLFGAVSLFEGFLASYFYKGKPKQH